VETTHGFFMEWWMHGRALTMEHKIQNVFAWNLEA
jgi:hypothetical protein